MMLNKTKILPLEIKETNDEESNFTFTGYASVYGNIDRDNEIIAKGAFDESLKEFIPKLYVQHVLSGIDGLPVGGFRKIKSDDIGLYVKGELPRDDARNRDIIIPQIKAGNIDSMSVGINARRNDVKIKDGIPIITKATLYEISLVNVPANPEANIDWYSKSLNNKFISEIETVREIEEILQNFGGFSQSQSKILISKMKSFYLRDVNRKETQRDVVNFDDVNLMSLMDGIINNLNNKNGTVTSTRKG